jgi:hypothetical protein
MRGSVGQLHDSRTTGEMLGHKTMAMTGWYVQKATAPLRVDELAAELIEVQAQLDAIEAKASAIDVDVD